MPAKQNDIDLEPLLHAHQEQLSLVMAEADSIDSKALAMLAAIVALLIFIGQAGLQLNAWWHALSTVLPLGLALLSTGFAIWPRHYIGPSIDLDQHPENFHLTRSELVSQLLVNTNYAIHRNHRYNQSRWRYCVVSIVLTLLAVSILFVIL